MAYEIMLKPEYFSNLPIEINQIVTVQNLTFNNGMIQVNDYFVPSDAVFYIKNLG